MEQLEMILLGTLMVMFAVGWLGCALAIPMAAIRFFAVLFEKDEDPVSSVEMNQNPPE
jgi:hypothetical protein